MTNLNLPVFEFRYKKETDLEYIFDEIRQKYLILTPEEWVRQNFVKYLVQYKKYPASLISMEMGFRSNKTDRRSDIVIYNRQGKIEVLIECKAPKVKLSQNIFDQAAAYNLKLNARFLIITNGLQHYCFQPDYKNRKWIFLNDIPDYAIL